MISRLILIIKKKLALINNAVIRNILIVGSIVLLIKIVSFYKETVVGSTFGLSQLLDTFYIAILIPSFVQHVFIGALSNLFIPNYIIEQKTFKKTGSFQSFVLLSISTLCVLLALILIGFTEFFLEFVFRGHTHEYYVLIKKQFYIVLPCIFLWGYSSFIRGLLEIDNKYFISTISQVFTPIVTILFLLSAKDFFGDIILVLGMLVGASVGFLFLLFHGIRYRLLQFSPIVINTNIRVMTRQYMPKVTSGFLTGINPFVDQFFAAQLVVGSVAAINYGTKIPAFMVGILMLALGNVLLPHFARLITEDLIRAKKQLFRILKNIFIFTPVVTIVLILVSDDIIRILFERKEFTSDDTFVVANIQRITLIYVPFYLCTLVCVKFLTAANRNKFMAWTSLWNLILNLMLNIIFIRYFGVYGLVLSTTIVYIVCSFIYIAYSNRIKGL